MMIVGSIRIVLLISSVFILAGAWWFGYQYDRVKYASEIDMLTKNYNRRFILSAFPKMQKKARKQSLQIGVFFIDINNFKHINDSFGHDAGDRVLQGVGRILNELFEEIGYVVRWGGDEFIVLLYMAEVEMVQLQKSIFSKLEALSQELKIDVDAAIGMMTYPNDEMNLLEIISAADKKMYDQKG